MSSLDQLQPLISPPPIEFWPPAPGWWLLLLLLPLVGFGLWKARRFFLNKRPIVRAEQPLDPVRLAALAELARMPKPYDGAPAGAWLQQLNGLLKRLCRNHYPLQPEPHPQWAQMAGIPRQSLPGRRPDPLDGTG